MKFVTLSEAADYVRSFIDPDMTNERLRKMSSRKSAAAWPRRLARKAPCRSYLYAIPVTDEEGAFLKSVIFDNGLPTAIPLTPPTIPQDDSPEEFVVDLSKDLPEDLSEKMYWGEAEDHGDARYHSEVDSKSGMVIAFMPTLKNGYIRVPMSADKLIHQLYSREGGNMQIMQISQSLNWRPFVLQGYLRARGLTHASHVWPEWEVENTSIDDLAKDAFVAKAEKAKAKADRLEASRITRDAEIGRSYKDMASFIQAMGFEPVVTEDIDYSSDADFDVYFPMKDLHVGKYPHGAPSDYSLQMQEETIIKAIDKALFKIVETWGVPRRFLLVTGDDQLNSNGSNQTTLKGTPVGASSVGSFREQALTLSRLKTYQIQACLRTGASVYDHYIPSNHAPDAEFLVAEIIKARFSENPRVVVNTTDSTMKVVAVGNIPMFDLHGTRLDDRNLPAAAARRCPSHLDFSRAVIFRGHTHAHATMLQKQSHENAGILIHVVPSSAPACAYEEANLWDTTQHLMAAYRIDYSEGCDSTLFIR